MDNAQTPQTRPRADSPEDLVGEKLDGRYELIEHLGSGSVGHVYRARDHRLEFREVAVKVLKPGLRDDQVARFRREALLTGGLSSPHLVQVTDFSTLPDGRSYLIMQLLRGRNLNVLLHQEGKLPIERALKIADGILAGLEAAHIAGVVHRDLKPENIFIVEEPGVRDHVKIVDFGFARVFHGGGDGLDVTGEAQIVIGTVSYMAPEQLRGQTTDHRADLFSVAVIVFKMLTGRLPYETSPTGTAMMLAAKFRATNLSQPPLRLSEYDPSFAHEAILEGVLMRALQTATERRFDSAGEMRRAFVMAMGKGAMPPDPSVPGTASEVWANPASGLVDLRPTETPAPVVLMAEEPRVEPRAVSRPVSEPPVSSNASRLAGLILWAFAAVLAGYLVYRVVR